MPFQKVVKYIGVWILIIGSLLLVYTYKNDIKKILNNVYINIIPGAIIEEVKNGKNTVSVIANQSGHFFIDSIVNGIKVRFLIDAGATDVALTRDDAKKLGVNLDKISYTKKMVTANGTIWCAPIKLDYIKIGRIIVYNVTASVGKGDKLNTGLLGMSFLNRLKSYQVHDNSLTMVGE